MLLKVISRIEVLLELYSFHKQFLNLLNNCVVFLGFVRNLMTINCSLLSEIFMLMKDSLVENEKHLLLSGAY